MCLKNHILVEVVVKIDINYFVVKLLKDLYSIPSLVVFVQCLRWTSVFIYLQLPNGGE